MIIAIDYDGTYAAAPEIFNEIINLFIAAGHIVICVTGRSAGVMGQPVLDSIGQLVPVIFAGTDWKADAAKKRGYNVNIWIDDMPGMISPVDII
jgi:hydroxymethylpyrimidine pyrophosphatase-like HAD family hydrolase